MFPLGAWLGAPSVLRHGSAGGIGGRTLRSQMSVGCRTTANLRPEAKAVREHGAGGQGSRVNANQVPTFGTANSKDLFKTKNHCWIAESSVWRRAPSHTKRLRTLAKQRPYDTLWNPVVRFVNSRGQCTSVILYNQPSFVVNRIEHSRQG
jgi:hypothetical protein